MWRLASQPSRKACVPSARSADLEGLGLDISIFLGHQCPCPLPGPTNISGVPEDVVRDVEVKCLPGQALARETENTARLTAGKDFNVVTAEWLVKTGYPLRMKVCVTVV